MEMNIRIIKKRASQALQQGIGSAILGLLAVFGINMAGSLLASFLFAGNDTLSLILYQVFLFIVSLISAVFSAGLSFMYLNMAREQTFSVRDLLYFFRNHPDRVIVAAFVMAVLNLFVSIPYYYYGLTAQPGTTVEGQTEYLVTTLGLLLLSQVLYMLVTLPFAMTYFLLADQRGLQGLAALRASMELMHGAKAKYFLLMLSFVPVLILSVFTLYLALLWIMPHMNMSEAVFYLKLVEQKELHRTEQEISGGIPLP